MISNNKEGIVLHEQQNLNPKAFEGNTFEELSKYMAQTQLAAAVLRVDKPSVSVFSKEGNINQLITNGNTLLEEVVIFWLHGMYGFINNLMNFIEYINFLISQKARFTDELNIQVQQDISKEISDFVEPINSGKYTIIAYKKEDVIFTSIRNARLKMGKLLESDFCRNNDLFNSHFNINDNKGYAQKNYNTGMRNYVVYRGCITMRASWSVMSSDKNSSKTIKKESISIYIKDNGTVHMGKQDELRYKNGEINFNGCRVSIGGIPLKDALNKGRWLYSHNQTIYDDGYLSCGTSSEGKASVFGSNNGDLVKSDICKNEISQESNKNYLIKDNSEPDTKEDNYQSIDLDDSSLGYSSDIESDSITYYKFPTIDSIILEKSIKISQIIDDNRTTEEENLSYLKKLSNNRFYKTNFNKKKCTYEQQTTIACDISVDDSQMSSKYSNQKNSVIASNNDQYCEDIGMGNEDLNTVDNHTVTLPEKINLLLNGRSYAHDITMSDATSNPQEPDRSSANGLSWDNNTLELDSDDMELNYNPPRRTWSFNCRQRSSSVPTRLGILREAPGNNSLGCNLNESYAIPTIIVTCPKAEDSISPRPDTPCEASDNNPSCNLNQLKVLSVLQDPDDNITKIGIYNIQRSFG